MKKNIWFLTVILFVFIFLGLGCRGADNNVATISVNPDSGYVKTFKDLGLGNIFDFDFKLVNPENTWIHLWVESYVDGIKETEPLISLNYGSGSEEVNDNIGFGMITLDSADTLAILYSSGVSTQKKTGHLLREDVFSSLEYTITDEEIEIESGETKLLAVYRETEGHSLHVYNLDDEQAIEQMIEGSSLVYLLKIKIEEE